MPTERELNALRTALQLDSSQAQGRHVLVDAALVPGLAKSVRPLSDAPLVLRPAAALPGEADDALPWLLPLPAAAWARDALLRASLDWASAGAAAWLFSPLAPQTLADALAARLEAQLTDNLQVLLRFSDAHVLPALAQTLEPEQRTQFFWPVQAWWFRRRDGVLQALPGGAGRGADPFAPPLHLSDAQHDALLAAAEPDAVIAVLRDQGADAIDRLDAAARHAFVADQIQRAARWRIDATRDVALLCIAALELGAAFADHAPWSGALDEVAAGRATLPDALEQAMQQAMQQARAAQPQARGR